MSGRKCPCCGTVSPVDGAERSGTWLQTFTGRKFWPMDPRPDEVCIEDIAHHLAYTCRFGGAPRRGYSVAEHCVLVSQNVPTLLAGEALLHDAAEAYIGDMIWPVKHDPSMVAFRELEAPIEAAIYERFGVDPTDESRAAIKEIDDRILIDEVEQLMADPAAYKVQPGRRLEGRERLGVKILGWSPADAEWAFLQRFRRLFPRSVW